MELVHTVVGYVAFAWILHGVFASTHSYLCRRIGFAPSSKSFVMGYLLTSLVVSSITCILYGYCVLRYVVFQFEPWRTTPIVTHSLAQHLAVTVYEWTTYAFQTKNIALHAHHVATIGTLYVFASLDRGGIWACWGGLVEFTNPPLSVSMLLHELGEQTNRGQARYIRLASNAAVCASYASFRITGIPLMLVVYGYCYARHPELARFADDIQTSNKLAAWFVIMSAFVMGLSVMWFGKILKYVRRIDRPARPPR